MFTDTSTGGDFAGGIIDPTLDPTWGLGASSTDFRTGVDVVADGGTVLTDPGSFFDPTNPVYDPGVLDGGLPTFDVTTFGLPDVSPNTAPIDSVLDPCAGDPSCGGPPDVTGSMPPPAPLPPFVDPADPCLACQDDPNACDPVCECATYGTGPACGAPSKSPPPLIPPSGCGTSCDPFCAGTPGYDPVLCAKTTGGGKAPGAGGGTPAPTPKPPTKPAGGGALCQALGSFVPSLCKQAGATSPAACAASGGQWNTQLQRCVNKPSNNWLIILLLILAAYALKKKTV